MEGGGVLVMNGARLCAKRQPQQVGSAAAGLRHSRAPKKCKPEHSGWGRVPAPRGIVADSGGGVAQAAGASPARRGIIPARGKHCPATGGTVPASAESLPVMWGSFPHTAGMIPVVCKTIPRGAGMIPHSGGSIPVACKSLFPCGLRLSGGFRLFKPGNEPDPGWPSIHAHSLVQIQQERAEWSKRAPVRRRLGKDCG